MNFKQLFLLLSLCFSQMAFAQIMQPVKWKTSSKSLGDGKFELIFDASIDDGYYVYSQFLEDGGPIPSTFDFSNSGVELVGKVEEIGKAKDGFDPIFEMNVRKFGDKVKFKAIVKSSKSEATFNVPLMYMTCNDESCVKLDEDFNFSLKAAAQPTKPEKEAPSITKPQTKEGAPTGSKAPPVKTDSETKSSSNTTTSQPKVESGKASSSTAVKSDAPTTNTPKKKKKKKKKVSNSTSSKTNSNAGGIQSEILDPVSWDFSKEDLGNGEFAINFNASLEDGWYIYSQKLPEGGPLPSEFYFDPNNDISFLTDQPAEISDYKKQGYDPIFEMDVTKYAKSVNFQQKVKLANPDTKITGHLKFMTCDSKRCLPPQTVSFAFNEDKNQGQATGGTKVDTKKSALDMVPTEEESKTPWGIFIAGFLGGLLALLTPCVFPMIPLTVSFFTKSSKTRAKGIRNGIVYALSIIFIYLALGFLVTALFGAAAMSELATNPWVNIAFFFIFIFFAFSFFGYYDIQLPTWLANKSDQAADKGGLIGIFFMAFTLSVVSFSCTGPIIGSLLVTAAEGGMIGPLLGMFGFSLALAFPFALFAAFPAWLNSLPSSGGWLNSVKVVLGFIEIALALKFLSNADLVMQWGLLKRETFLILWIIILVLIGIYLLGKIKFPHDSPVQKLSKTRVFLAIASFAFAIYLIPGIFCKPLSLVSGFPPPDFYSYGCAGHCPHDLACIHDYEEGLEIARKSGKPLFVDFTGWACVNCRKMEETVWNQPGIMEKLQNDYVIVSLYVDEKKDLPSEEQFDFTDHKGKTKKAVTVGDKWAQMQISCFKSNSQPKYILLDHKEEMLKAKTVGFTSAETFKNYLSAGLNNFNNGIAEAKLQCSR